MTTDGNTPSEDASRKRSKNQRTIEELLDPATSLDLAYLTYRGKPHVGGQAKRVEIEKGLPRTLVTEAAAPRTTRFLYGDTPSIAEIALVPQVANARRFKVDISAFPALIALDAACLELDAVRRAAPESQKPA